MSKLSKLFMALSVLCVRCACLRAGRSRERSQLGRHFRWIFHGVCLRHLRAGAGQGDVPRPRSSLARNPAARPGIQLALILGLALIESLALYTLVIIFAKVK